MSTQPSKQDFVQWMLDNLPGVEDYFSTNKLNAWALGQEGSVEYDRWYNQYCIGDRNALRGSLLGRLTGLNPNYASYMAKAKNSGDMVRGEIAIIQNEQVQTQNQIDMWTAILKTNTTDAMKAFAQSLLDSYTKQLKQVSDTLALYQKDLADGIASGKYS